MYAHFFSDPDSRVKSRVPKVTKRKVLVTFPTEVLIEYDLKKKIHYTFTSSKTLSQLSIYNLLYYYLE